MFYKTKKAILIFLTIIISQNVSAAYLVSELGRLPGYVNEYSPGTYVDLNNKGEIAGTVFRYMDFWFTGMPYNQFDFRAFYASETKGVIDIGDLGGNVAAALAINDVGKIGGWSTLPGTQSEYYSIGGFSNSKGFVWDSDGMTQVEQSYVLDIDNDDNLLTHGYVLDSFGPESKHKHNDLGQSIHHGFGAESTILGFSSHLYAYPYDYSNREIVNCEGCTASFYDGVQWIDIGTISGSWSTAYDLNNSGQVVGTSAIDDPDDPGNDGQIRAFLWQNNVMKDLIAEATTLPSDAEDVDLLQNGDTRAISINNNGQILIQAVSSRQYVTYLLRNITSYLQLQYYIWENDVISKIDVTWPDSTRQSRDLYLSAINDNGQLAGFGSPDTYWDYVSEWHVVLLTPEENTTDLALSVSGDAAGLINQDLTINYLIENLGNHPTIPQLIVSIPDSISAVSLPDECTNDSSTVTCTLNELGENESKSLVFTLSGSQIDTHKVDANVISTSISDPKNNNNIVRSLVNLLGSNQSLQISFPQDNTIIGRDPESTGNFQLEFNTTDLDISEGNNQVKVSIDGNFYNTVSSSPISISDLNDGEHLIEIEVIDSADQSLGISDSIHVHVAKETVIEVGRPRHFFGRSLYTHDLDIKGDFFIASGEIPNSETQSGSLGVIYFYHYQNGEWQRILPWDINNIQNMYEASGGVASNGGLTPLANVVDIGSPFWAGYTGIFNPQMTYPISEEWHMVNQYSFTPDPGYSLAIEGYNTIILGDPDYDSSNVSGHAGGVRISSDQILTATNLQSGDLLGFSVAIENGIVVAGAIGDDDNGSFSGAAYVYDLNLDPTTPQKLLAEDGVAFDRFGHGVAISQNTIAIGAPLNDEAGDNIGAIYLFNKIEGQWQQTNKLMPSNYSEPPQSYFYQSSGTTFGNIVQFDGDFIVTTGAKTYHPYYDDGEVHFFRRTEENGWGKSRKILSASGPSSSTMPYLHGYDASISGNFLGVKTNSDVHIFELNDIEYATDFSMTYQELNVTNDLFEPIYTDQPNIQLLGQLDLFNLGPKQPSSEVVFTFPEPVSVSLSPQCNVNTENPNEVICFTGDIISSEPYQFKFWILQDHDPLSVYSWGDTVIFGPANEGGSFADSDMHARIRSRWPDPNTGNNNVVIRFPNLDIPRARDDNHYPAEGDDYSTNTSVLRNDSDLLSRTLTIETTPVQAPSYGELTINGDGTFRYIHDGSEFSQDSFIYQISNGVETATATVFLNIRAVNDPPIVESDEYSVEKGATLEIIAPGVMENDSDVDGDELTVSLTEQALHGLVTLNSNGQFTYVHDGSNDASDAFTYTLSDGNETVVGTVALNILNTNDLPIVEDVSFQIENGGTLDIVAPGLLENAQDDNGDSLTLETTPVTEPSHGELTLYSNGAFTYIHDGSPDDSDSFIFRVSDGQATVDASVTITIFEANRSPQATLDAYTLNEGATLILEAPGLLNNDIDPDGDLLLVNTTPQTQPQHGTLTLNDDGSFEYVHNGSQALEDSFVYSISDGELGDTAIVSLSMTNINDIPVAEPDIYSVIESGLLDIPAPGLLDNDIDADGDSLSVLTEVESGPSHGTLTLNSDGSFSYQHNGNEVNVDHFTYQITDGFETVNALVTINIGSANDAPVANDDEYALEEGDTLTIESPGLLTNDTDVDNSQLVISTIPEIAPLHGRLTLQTDGSFTYIHDGSENLQDSFVYSLNDGESTDTATVSLTISNRNDTPVAEPNIYLVAESALLEIESPGLLDNDFDADGDNLTVLAEVLSGPTHGTVSLNSDGAFVYQHNGDEINVDHFTYLITDGIETVSSLVTINITPVNDSPVANPNEFTLEEGSTLTIESPGLLDNDSDVDSNQLIVKTTPEVSPLHGTLTLRSDGSFTYIHDGSENTEDSFVYAISDGELFDTAMVTLTVINTNDIPVAEPNIYLVAESALLEVESPGLLGNDFDADGDNLSVLAEVISGPSFGTLSLNSNGSFTYQHNGDEENVDYFTYQVTDGQETVNALVTINIGASNDAPVANSDTYTLEEGSHLSIAAPGLLENDTDADSNQLIVVTTPNVLPSHGTLVLQADGSFTYVHDGSETLTDSFEYTINDGIFMSNSIVTLNIEPTNDAPIAESNRYIVEESLLLEVASPGLLDNDIDADGDPLSVLNEVVSGPSHGTLVLNSNGSFIYQHSGDEVNVDYFTYQITDGSETVNALVTININSTNDAPQANADNYDLEEGGILTIEAPGLLDNDTDAENNQLIVLTTPTELPEHGTLTITADGAFEYTHDGSETLEDSFKYTISDGILNSSGTVTLTIEPDNDAPTANSDIYEIATGALLEVSAPGLLGNDSDTEGDVLSVLNTPQIAPAHGVLNLSSDGSFTYQHDGSKNSSDSFTYQLSDGENIALGQVTININKINHPPVASADEYNLEEGATFNVSVPGLLANDSDANADQLIVSTTPHKSPEYGELTLESNGSFRYIHDGSENFEDSFSYTISDGKLFDQANVSLTILNINDIPVAQSDNYQIEASGLLNVSAPGLLANDSDDDNDTLVLVETLHKAPQFGTVEIHSDGSFTYSHDGSQNTADSFEYTVSDQKSEAIGLVNISILTGNTPPIAEDQEFDTLEDVAIENQQLEASDNENDTLTYSVTLMPSKGSLLLSSDGLFNYEPFANENGTDQFNFTINDGNQDAESEATVTIQIIAQNDAPKASRQRLLVQQEELSQNSLNVTDIDSEHFTFLIVDEPEKGEVTINENTGEFDYTSFADQRGPDSFTYQVSDGDDSSNIATVSIVINARGNNKPTKPKLLSPGPDTIDLTTDVEFIWENSEDEDGDQLSYSLLICSNADFVDCDAETIQKISIANLLPLTGLSFVLFGLTGVLHRRRWLLLAVITIVIVLSGCDNNSSSSEINLNPNNKAIDLSHTVNDLKSGTQYYWKIIVEDAQGGIAESETRMFVTAD